MSQSKHQRELHDFRDELHSQVIHPKFSKRLLNLRKIQESLAKQKNFEEAYKIKKKAKRMVCKIYNDLHL